MVCHPLHLLYVEHLLCVAEPSLIVEVEGEAGGDAGGAQEEERETGQRKRGSMGSMGARKRL